MEIGREEPSRIKELLKNNPRGMNVTEIAREIGLNRLSVAKYLEMLVISGHIEVKAFGPSKVYFLSQRLPISAMLSLSSDFIVILDKDLRIINVNDKFLEFAKLKQSDIMYQKFDTLSFPLEFRPSLLPSVIAALNGENFTAEAYFKKKETESFFNIKFIPLVFDDGQKGVTLLFEDITARKRIELAVKESELKLRSIIEQSLDGIILTNEQGKIIEYNDACETIFGIGRDKAIGMHIWDFQAKIYKALQDDKEHFVNVKLSIQKLLKTGKLQEKNRFAEDNILRPDNTSRSIQVSSFPIETENGYMICGIVRDVTELKLTEQAIKESEAQHRAIFEQAAVGIAFVDNKDRIITTNQRFCAILGYSKGELTNLTYRDITYPDDMATTEEKLDKLKSGSVPSYSYEKRYIRKDGSIVWANVTASLLRLNDPESYQIVVIEDITARKSMEEALRKAEHHLATAQQIARVGSWEVVPNDSSLDLKNVDVHWSDEMYRILSIDPESGITAFSQFLDLVVPEDRDIVTGMQSDLRINHRSDGRDVRILTLSGVEKILYCESGVDLNEDGTIVRIFGTIQDVTERKHMEEALRKARDELEKTVDERTLELQAANAALKSEILEKIRTGEALRESEFKYRVVADNTGDWEFWLGTNGEIKYMSPSCEHITGYAVDEFVKDPDLFINIVHPDDRLTFKNHIKSESQKGIRVEMEFRIITNTGETRWIHHLCKPIYDDSGLFIGTRGSNRDITDRKYTEEALQDSEARYRAFFDNSMDALLITSPDGSVLGANSAACRMYGISEDEVKRAGRTGLVDATDPRLETFLREREKNGHYFGELRNRRKDGSLFPTEQSSGLFTDNKGHTYSAMIVRDITTRKQLEEKLEKFKLFSENTRDIVLFFGTDGRILEANEAAVRAYGYSYDELLSMNIYALRIKDPRKVIDDQMNMAHDNGLLFETVHRRKDGSTFPVEVSARGMLIAGEKTLLSVIRDITERKTAEDALMAKQEKLEIQAEELESQAEELRINNDELEKEIEYRQKAQSALEASEIRFRSLIQNSSDIIRILDKDGLIIYESSSSGKILGYPDGYTLGKSPYNFIHPDDLDRVRNDLGEVYNKKNTGTPTEFRIRRGDGKYLDVESVAMNLFGVPGVDGIVITTRAITERKRAEEAICISEYKYRSLVENISDAAWEIDTNLVYTYMSPRSIPIIGYMPEELLGKTPYDIMGPEEAKRVKGLLNKVSTARLPFSLFECKLLHKDGHTVHVEISGTPIFYSNGTFSGYRGITRDVTQRKKDQEDLARANRSLRLLTDCDHALIRSNDMKTLLENICKIIVDSGGYRMAWVGMSGKERGGASWPLIPSSGKNDPGTTAHFTWKDIVHGHGPAATAVKSGKPAVVRDIMTDGGDIPWQKEAVKQGFASILSLPFVSNGATHGVLTIYSDKMDDFADEEIKLLEELAGNISHGIVSLEARNKK
jgi:PAS domain S-box-containing protein